MAPRHWVKGAPGIGLPEAVGGPGKEEHLQAPQLLHSEELNQQDEDPTSQYIKQVAAAFFPPLNPIP